MTTYLILLSHYWNYCKSYSTKTRIVTSLNLSFIIPLIAKAILLKQGLWQILISYITPNIFIAKAILLKQGLWLVFIQLGNFAVCNCKSYSTKTRIVTFVFSVPSSSMVNCKSYSTKTRIVTSNSFNFFSPRFKLQKLFY